MKNFINKYFFDLLLIFILSLTPLFWFQGDAMMVGHDNVFPLNPAVFLNGRLFSWIELGFGRSQALIMGTIPVHLIDAIPYLLGFSLQATQKIVYVFWFFLMGVSAYVLASVLNKDSRYFRLTAVVFYIFNYFILQAWWIGERTKFSAYIAFPLILAVFLKVYKKDLGVVKGAILTSLILFVFNGGGLFGLSLYGGFLIAMITFILFFSLLSIYQKQYPAAKRLLLLTVFSIFGFLMVNSYYIFPAASQVLTKYTEGVQKTGGSTGLIDWASEISANASYGNLLRLQGIAEWYDNPEHPYSKNFLTNPILILISFLWPFLIFLNLILIKKWVKLKFVIYFSIVYLLGVFVAAGTHPPFGFIYALFIKYIPGSIAFRSPYFKFAPAIFLAASFLIAFFVDYFQGKIKKIVFVLMILIVLIYHFPYFTVNFFEWRKGFSTRNNIPDYTFEFGRWAENEMGKDNRILLLPQANANWQYDIYKWGYLSLQVFPTLVTNKGIVSNDDKVSSEEMILLEELYAAIENKDFYLTQKLSRVLGIRYFLVRQDFESDLEWIPANNYKFYKTILEKDFNLYPMKRFGKWIVYRLNENDMSKFTMVNTIDNLYGEHTDIDNYYSLAGNDANFIFKSDYKTFLDQKALDYIVPECLSCRHEVAPNINYPKRLVLPDSIFYPIIKYREQKELQNLAPREAAYANLGHTLKRIGEILTTFNQGKNINPKLLSNYLIVLQRLENSFDSINDNKDKFEAAEDIHYYLTPQKNYLHKLLGSNINGKEIINIADDVFEKIFNIESAIDPYLFKLNSSNNKLFLFDLGQSGSYEILLKKDDIDTLIKDKSRFTLLLDEQTGKEINVEKENFQGKWLSFGKLDLSSGEHNILLSLPDLPNLLENFTYKNNWFGSKLGDNCYGGNIKNFNSKKVYKLNFKVFNDFSEKIYVYEVKNKTGTEQIENVIKLERHFETDGYESLLYSLKDVDNISIYVCSANLNKETVQNKISINMTEVIRPGLIIKPQIKNNYSKINLTYKKINPTKYIIEAENIKPTVLIFSERYDNGWKLSDFDKNHFKVNGYANGWYLDKPGKFSLTLEYQPQRYFYYGIMVSLISVIGGLIYFFRTKNN